VVLRSGQEPHQTPTPSETRMWRSLADLASNRIASGSIPHVSKPALSYKCFAAAADSLTLRCTEAAPCLSFGSSGRTPEGTGIGTIWVKLQHLVVELACSFCRVVQPNEVADVLPRFFHILRTVIVAGNLHLGMDECRYRPRVDATIEVGRIDRFYMTIPWRHSR
jgi:hypothetical protein